MLLGGYEYGNPGGPVHARIPRLEMWCYDVAANQWRLIKHFEAKEAPALGGGYVGCMPVVAAVGSGDLVVAPVYKGVDNPRDTWACRVDPTASEAAALTTQLGVPPGTVKPATGVHDPRWFEEGPPADESAVAAKLANLQPNQWVAMGPPKLFPGHTCRSWSTFAFDPHRDQILLWGGGHGDYGGTSVAHYSPRQNRWSIDRFGEFNMDYQPESSAGGWALIAPLSGRPFAGHSYLTYDYHAPTRKMYFIYGRASVNSSYFWAYDPDRRDWELPQRLPFPVHPHSSALRSTGHGLVAWTGESLWLCPDPTKGKWELLVEKGKHSIPRHYTEDSGLVWDSKRDRLLLFNPRAIGPRIWVYDFKTRAAAMLEPRGSDTFPPSAIYGWQACYLPDDDLVMVPTPAKPNPLTLFYDCAANEWLRLDNVGGKDGNQPTPGGYGVSIGVMWDPIRKLVWIGDGYMPGGRIWVMKFDRRSANLKPAGESQ